MSNIPSIKSCKKYSIFIKCNDYGISLYMLSLQQQQKKNYAQSNDKKEWEDKGVKGKRGWLRGQKRESAKSKLKYIL